MVNTLIFNSLKDLEVDMNDNQVEKSSDTKSIEEKRQDYYRACIAEFQQLGYQEQYLEQIKADSVPLTGLNPLAKDF